jgi:hypothetical protein
MGDARTLSFALAFATSCGDGGEDGAAEPADSCTVVQPDPACDCIPEQSNLILETPTCAPLLCAVRADYVEFDFCSSVPTVHEEALACALEALEKRTPGVITWELGGGYCGSFGYTVILPDGRAINRDISYFDYGMRYSELKLGDLLPSSTFADCAARAEPVQRFACLESTVVMSPVILCEESVPEWECEE